MAVRALPPGVARRRALFGLLDADGWTWATLKSLFWFLLILFLLGYVPDRAYYFTVSPTVDVGFNAISPINLCSPENRGLPCPAPAGALVPWEQSPAELALPEPRAGALAFASGTNLYLIGGESGGAPTERVLSTQVTTDGNFGQWGEGPALPAARTQAAYASLSGTPYVIGGSDAAGTPTDTVYVGTLENGVLTGWEENADLRLPAAVRGASAVAVANGIYLFGGRTAEGLSDRVYHARFAAATPPRLEAWEEVQQLPLPEPRADAAVAVVGQLVYLLGGEGPQGITNTNLRLQLTGDGEPATNDADQPLGWAVSSGGQSLPEPRSLASTFTANGALYVIGGQTGNGPASTVYWAVPNAVTGDLPEWRRRNEIDLPAPRARGTAVNVGSFAFLVGGESAQGPDPSSLRANISPKPPFFRLGLFGATLPALSIKGEIGQQLGYIISFGVGMTNFVVLILIGLAFSHRRQTMRVLERVTRGRVRAPREEEYGYGGVDDR